MLRDTVRRNRERLFARPEGGRCWDYCVVTAATRRQASLYRAWLDERREVGLLPPGTRVLAVADPPGARIGSGGATLWALRAVARDLRRSRGLLAAAAARRLARLRVLIIQSGGDSRRAPLHAATGKLFAKLPIALPCDGASTVFDELWAVLQPLAEALPANAVAAASGDVLLAFDPCDVPLDPCGVTALACRGDAETGSHHGVYVIGEHGEVDRFLQKASPACLRQAGAVDAEGRVAIDSGVLVFAGEAGRRLAGLSAHASRIPAAARRSGAPLDLYTHFVSALSGAEPLEGDPMLVRLRDSFGSLSFRAVCPEPSLFTHLGSTRLFRDGLSSDATLRRVYGFDACVSAPGSAGAGGATVVSSVIPDETELGDGALVVNASADAPLKLGRGAVLSHVDVGDRGTSVESNVVVTCVPVRLAGRRGHAAVVYGVDDDPRQLLRASAAFHGQPFREWLRRRRIRQADVWSDVPPAERALWNACLHPVAATDAEALDLALWMQTADPPDRPALEAWLVAPRIAMSDLAALMDSAAIRGRAHRLDARIAVETALADIEATGSLRVGEALAGLPDRPRAIAVRSLAGYASRTPEPLRRCRVLASLSDLAARPADGGGQPSVARTRAALAEAAGAKPKATMRRVSSELMRRAFGAVSLAVRSDLPHGATRSLAVSVGSQAVADAPVRIDLAGGWSDTPPYCFEHGGAVVNLAVDLDGKPPVRVTATPISESVVRLISEDQNVDLTADSLRPLRSYARPGDPLAIAKAALFCGRALDEDGPPLREQLGRLGAGLELRVSCDVPKGSGLGASSVVGAAVLAALGRACGCEYDQARLLEDVLRLEQMLTTGGGWQDQVGGAVCGIKLTTSDPGTPQKLQVRRIVVPGAAAAELARRLRLVYTGRTRVAKNILQNVMGRYMARNPKAVQALDRLKRLAHEVAASLRAGDIDAVGRCMREQWVCNRILDPQSTDDHIDSLFRAVEPFAVGAKLAGAGGGGFMAVMMREGLSPAETDAALRRVLQATDARRYALETNEHGLRLNVGDAL